MRRRWTTAELAELRHLWQLGTTAAGIGRILGRTPHAIIKRATKLNLGPRAHRLWTPAMVTVLCVYHGREPAKVLARRLSTLAGYPVTPYAVVSKAARLRLGERREAA